MSAVFTFEEVQSEWGEFDLPATVHEAAAAADVAMGAKCWTVEVGCTLDISILSWDKWVLIMPRFIVLLWLGA